MGSRSNFPLIPSSGLVIPQEMHQTAVAFAYFVAIVTAIPNEFKRGLDGSPLVIEYDVGTHQHIQTGDAGNAVRGSYSYLSTDGSEHIVNYVADENGYRVITGNRPISPAQFTLVPVITEPITLTESIDIAEPTATTEAIEMADPIAEAEPDVVTEPVTASVPFVAADPVSITEEVTDAEPTVTESTPGVEPEMNQPASDPVDSIGVVPVVPVIQKPLTVPVIQSDNYAVPSGYKLVPISYGSYPYPYRYNQFPGYHPYGFSDGLRYYQGGYSLPLSYGYGYNAGQIGSYVLKPIKETSSALILPNSSNNFRISLTFKNNFNCTRANSNNRVIRMAILSTNFPNRRF